MSVDIVLATYNGDRFLDAQLQSILAQDYPHWHLLIRDDESCDLTPKIIQTYLQKEPQRLQWIKSGESTNLGILRNFNHLLEHSSASYTFFCDQDDIWLPHKVTASLAEIGQLEAQWGKDLPMLVHSDLRVVSEQLELIHPSFWRSHHLDPTRDALRHLLIRNHITGCTIVINKALKELALPLPDSAFMHDWWLGLVASAFGKIAHLKQPTILYRQHQHNQVGAQSQKLRYLVTRLQQPQKIREYYRKTQKQAQEFLNRYGAQLSEHDREMVSAYCGCEKLAFCAKRKLLIRYELFDVGLARNLALLSLI